MHYYKTEEEIKKVVKLLNSRLYNAGYSFKVIEVSNNCVYVQGSFDFSYYVNVHIQFEFPVFTNLKEREEWPDAWHDDQLFLLDEEDELNQVLDWYDIEKKDKDEKLYAFVFNINGRRIDSKTVVVCKELYVRWEHPYYD